MNNLYGVKVAYALPDNQLSLDLAQEYIDNKNLAGMPCMIRGRAHHNDDLSPPCKIAQQFLKSRIPENEYNNKVSFISDSFCKVCHYRNNCAYIEQFKTAKNSHIVFMTHDYLFTITSGFASTEELEIDPEISTNPFEADLKPSSKRKQKSLIESFTHLIIDEDIVSRLILNNTIGKGVFSYDRQDSDVIKGMIDDIDTGVEVVHVLNKWKDQITKEYTNHKRIDKPVPITNHKDLNDDGLRNGLDNYRRAEQKKTFWKILNKTCNSLDVLGGSTVYINNVWVDGNELKVCEKLKINSLWKGKKILYLDASANPEIVKEALGLSFKVRKVKTHTHEDYSIVQVHDNLFTKNHLKENYQKIFRSLKKYFGDVLPAFITYKDIELRLKAEPDVFGNIPLAGHYLNIKGIDDFKKQEILLVVGRYMINPQALKGKTRMLYPITTEPINFNYEERGFIYRMKDGRNQSVKQKDYIIDSEVWKLNNHLSRSEMEQAIGRIRPFGLENVEKKTVYVFCSQVLDITVDKLISSDDFFPSTPRKTGNEIHDAIINLLDNNGGILKWKPAGIIKDAKQLFKGTKITTTKLNSAKSTSWFLKNTEWKLMTVTYKKIDEKSRKLDKKVKLIVLNDLVVDEEMLCKMYPNEVLQGVTIKTGW